MEKFKFIPRIGMRTEDSYLHGLTMLECITSKGVIEHVGIDYFILRVEDKGPFIITEGEYWAIEEQDFK